MDCGSVLENAGLTSTSGSNTGTRSDSVRVYGDLRLVCPTSLRLPLYLVTAKLKLTANLLSFSITALYGVIRSNDLVLLLNSSSTLSIHSRDEINSLLLLRSDETRSTFKLLLYVQLLRQGFV